MSERAAAEPGVLYVVGTPIGNLGDLSERARETLAAVDIVAAEDTRRTGLLLSRLGLPKARLVSLHEANERERIPQVLSALRSGESVALVSDGGMPVVSDPGFPLVRACVEAGLDVRVVPGPSAALAALVVSGLPTDRFVFEGFLPRRGRGRRARLESLASEQRTTVLFESPRRVEGTLQDLLEALGDRPVALCRELTKLHEEVLRGRVSEVLETVRGRDVKGEVVLVVGGGEGSDEEEGTNRAVEEAERMVQGGARARVAAGEAARRHGASANAVYRALLRRRA